MSNTIQVLDAEEEEGEGEAEATEEGKRKGPEYEAGRIRTRKVKVGKQARATKERFAILENFRTTNNRDKECRVISE